MIQWILYLFFPRLARTTKRRPMCATPMVVLSIEHITEVVGEVFALVSEQFADHLSSEPHFHELDLLRVIYPAFLGYHYEHVDGDAEDVCRYSHQQAVVAIVAVVYQPEYKQQTIAYQAYQIQESVGRRHRVPSHPSLAVTVQDKPHLKPRLDADRIEEVQGGKHF
jgi:hypothetical protein